MDNRQLDWILSGVSILLIPIIILVACCRDRRFEIPKDYRQTTADVIRTMHSYKDGTKYHHMEIRFIHDETHKYLPILVEKYIVMLMDNQYKILPSGIVNLCIEMIGYDCIQWFLGP